MGKGLNGKELGKGIRQRKDGRYETRIYNPGTPKYVSLYDTNLQRLKKQEMTHYYTHIEDDFMKKEYTKFTKIYTEERGN